MLPPRSFVGSRVRNREHDIGRPRRRRRVEQPSAGVASLAHLTVALLPPRRGNAVITSTDPRAGQRYPAASSHTTSPSTLAGLRWASASSTVGPLTVHIGHRSAPHTSHPTHGDTQQTAHLCTRAAGQYKANHLQGQEKHPKDGPGQCTCHEAHVSLRWGPARGPGPVSAARSHALSSPPQGIAQVLGEARPAFPHPSRFAFSSTQHDSRPSFFIRTNLAHRHHIMLHASRAPPQDDFIGSRPGARNHHVHDYTLHYVPEHQHLLHSIQVHGGRSPVVAVPMHSS